MSDAAAEELIGLFKAETPLPPSELREILDFYLFLRAENKKQNLTRLIEPRAFFYGHWWDVWRLHSEKVEFPALDLGSGCGVPGLLHSIWTKTPWILVEAEKKKAEFLRAGIRKFGLSETKVKHARMEDIQKQVAPKTIVARAVGSAEKMLPWIQRCSTWNRFILLKGPKWEVEREGLSRFPWIEIEKEESYQHPPEFNDRRIVVLRRVPRGTTTQ